MSDNMTPEEIARLEAEEQARRVQLPAGEPVKGFLDIAEALTPVLHETEEAPQAWVQAQAAPEHPLRFLMSDFRTPAELEAATWLTGSSFIVDFGGHRAGYLSFSLVPSQGMADSPVRLRLTFGEVPTDVAEPLRPYRGWLSEAWLQEEIITVDDLPRAVRMSRRYAFRYVKVEVIATSVRFGVRFENLRAHAVTSAPGQVAALPESTPAWKVKMDHISITTLRSCLQTSFEDGPRRDRRLWVGDLRLQALANYVTFRANDVVKRCLFLFAGLPRSDGMVNGCVYERPVPTYADTVTLDYAAIFNVTLQEYVDSTGDLDTGRQLWPVACRQIEILLTQFDKDDLFVDTGATWCFIDWHRRLDRNAAMQGVVIFALRRSQRLALLLGENEAAALWEIAIQRLTAAARQHLFDAEQGLFVSGTSKQVSCASQAWLVLAGVAENHDQAAHAIRQSLTLESSLKPVTPYLYHYITEAMVSCGMKADAVALMQHYWGGMVDAGADTFWEAYDPKQPLISPYGDIHVNSFCHAWSCTPTYFIRAGLLD